MCLSPFFERKFPMNDLVIDAKGLLSLDSNGQERILPSPVGVLVFNGKALLPEGAEQQGDTVILKYPCGSCAIKVEKKKRYHKLTVVSVPEGSDAFVFGPYETKASDFGEVLGVGWHDDGSAVCIQSLMPKVVGGCKAEALKDKGELPLYQDAAGKIDGKVYLQCSVSDRTKPSKTDYLGMKDVLVKPVELPDGGIEGAAVALISAESADNLISVISNMEVEEGLPHPTYLGSYAKTDKRANSYYMIFGGNELSNEECIEYAGRAGVSAIYFSNMLERWGHFKVDSENFPGGIDDVRHYSDMAAEHGTTVGTHTLSNFIHTNDPYVSPVPHDGLLAMDETVLAKDISKEDQCVYIEDDNNYGTSSTLNVFRVGDELITYKDYDSEHKCVSGCTRGAFGTAVSAHHRGDKVLRLWDHGYGTLFPDIDLQKKMADDLGTLIRDGKLKRMSFDGLEGCAYTGTGEYAMADYVKRVLDIVGNDIICEGSMITHYLWHAFAYCNWGEPWYDDVRRGGMYAYRAGNIPFLKRNLIPCMLGWYAIWLNRGRYEATPPENVEFILSRSAAFDAGMALFSETDVPKNHGKYGEYLDLVKLWGDFRINADIPDNVRERMQEETGSWHLEKTEDGWNLSQLIIRQRDLDYTDCVVKAEGGYVNNNVQENQRADRINHSSHIVCDRSYEGVEEVPMFRIRVGEPGHGYMENPEFECLKFTATAEGGDYLEYRGGMELYHYDANFNLKEIITGEGRPLTWDDLWFKTLKYTTDTDEYARYIMTEIRTRRIYRINPLTK